MVVKHQNMFPREVVTSLASLETYNQGPCMSRSLPVVIGDVSAYCITVISLP